MVYAHSIGHKILLIADSPKYNQLIGLMKVALEKETPLSIRNVEPHVLCKMFPLSQMSNRSEIPERFVGKGLLEYCHSPIQSLSEEILDDMNRPKSSAYGAYMVLKWLSRHGVKTATNIIIDYKGMEDDTLETVTGSEIDYVSWNPLWDGEWNRMEAERRMNYYSRYF